MLNTAQNLPSVSVNFTASGGGEVMPSVSIEKIVSCRQHALARVAEALALLAEADAFSQAAGGNVFSVLMRTGMVICLPVSVTRCCNALLSEMTVISGGI